MPVTRSELMFFTAGVVAGAVGHKAYPKLKEKFAPLLDAALAGAGNGLGDGYADVIQTLAERFDRAREAAKAAAESQVHPAHERNPPHAVVS
ncbi:MAG: hypothetical protein U0800_11235 [Isosphaeraceae bacterium]